MIQKETIVSIIDNTGAKQCIIIKTLHNKKYIQIGDITKCSITKCKKSPTIKKGKIFNILITQTKQPNKKYLITNNNNLYLKFKKNTGILLDNQNNPIGTKINEIIPKPLIINKNIQIKKLCKYTI